VAVEYVMVPVPEELVEDVHQYLRYQDDLRRVAATPADASLDLPRMQALLADLDGDARGVLVQLATQGAGENPTVLGLAVSLGRSPREVVGTVYELNLLLTEAGGLGAMMAITPQPEGESVHDRVLGLPDAVASLVREAI
jgi:hypothetical protein